MTGAELKQLRQDLGEAIGRRLSLADMARICGLKDPERNGKDTWRKWEDGEGPSGPVMTLMGLLRLASNCYRVPNEMVADQIKVADTQAVIQRDIVEAVIRASMAAEIRRRLSSPTPSA